MTSDTTAGSAPAGYGTEAADTESVVRRHLTAFLEQQGIPAIVADYDDDARFLTEQATFHGKSEIGGFFASFIDALPDGAFDRFALRTLRIHDDLAYITWSVGDEFPLGTDTFVVSNGKITLQTYAGYSLPSDRGGRDRTRGT